MCRGKTKLIMLAILLLFQAAPCYAQTGFQDVSASDKYYEDISFLYSGGLLHGCGDMKFYPDALMKRKDLLTILHRYNGFGVNLYEVSPALGTQMLEILELSYDSEYMTRLEALMQIFHAMDVVPYSWEYYEDTDLGKFSELTDKEKSTVLLADMSGILDLERETVGSLKTEIRRDEAAGLLSAVIHTKEREALVKPPADFDGLQVIFTDDVEKGNREAVIANQAADLPQWLVEDFIDKGFEIYVRKNLTYEGWKENVSGIYHSQRGISLNGSMESDTVIYHEFGHHLYYNFADSRKVAELYRKEKEALAEYYRAYGKTSEEEFFAEAFALYIKEAVAGEKGKMQEAIPQIYGYLEELVKV